MRLRRFLFTFCCVVASCLAAAAAENPAPVARADLNAQLRDLGPYSSVQFLTNEIVLISNGRPSPHYAVYDIAAQKILRTGVTCAFTGADVWATPAGNILAACAQGLVLYDRNFQKLAEVKIPYSNYTVRDTLTFSPTRKLVAVNPLLRRSTTQVLVTDTLAEFATVELDGAYLYGLSEEGYLTYGAGKKQGWVLTLHPFHSAKTVALVTSKQTCWRLGFTIGESEFLKTPCGKDAGKIIDLSNAQTKFNFPDSDRAVFAQTTVSEKRFALGFQTYTKGHELTQAINPMTYVLALGACCDDPANLFKLRVYDQRSGDLLAEFRWQTRKKEPTWEKYNNSGVALSPDGEYVAFLRGTAVEIYRIPNSALN